MKPWIGCDIRLLRNQLGWSRTQLARHLRCSPLKVVKMEADDVIPIASEKVRLHALALQVEEHLKQFHGQVQVEAFLQETGADQVRGEEAVEYYADSQEKSGKKSQEKS